MLVITTQFWPAISGRNAPPLYTIPSTPFYPSMLVSLGLAVTGCTGTHLPHALNHARIQLSEVENSLSRTVHLR